MDLLLPIQRRKRVGHRSECKLLRSTSSALSKRDVSEMIKKRHLNHASDLSRYGLASAVRGHAVHSFETRMVLGDRVIIDHRYRITWQLSGSPGRVTWLSAREYARGMRRVQFAGLSRWRLPSIEELASLIEFDKQDHGLYIDVRFDPEQRSCWSADRDRSTDAVWGVHFDNGTVTRGYSEHLGYARLVCSGNNLASPETLTPLAPFSGRLVQQDILVINNRPANRER
jgi:uncharacterized protein DUF1566